MLWKLKELIIHCRTIQTEIDGEWLPCRPIGASLRERFKPAWLVLIGKADAFIWPGDQ